MDSLVKSIESDVKNYKIASDEDSETSKEFQNLCNFIKYTDVKESKKYNEAESSTSKWWGDLLVKYYDQSLSIPEIKEILSFVNTYNNSVNTLLFNENTSGIELRLKAVGLYTTQDYKKSLLNKFVSDFYNIMLSSSIIGENSNIITELTKINWFKSYRIDIISYIFRNIMKEYCKFNDTKFNDIPINFIEKKDADGNYTEFPNTLTGDAAALKTFLDNKFISATSLPASKMYAAMYTALHKDTIILKIEENGRQYEKLSASTTEKSFVELSTNCSDFCVFDITVSNKNFSSEEINSLNLIFPETTINEESFCSFYIVYKELNLKYRTLLNSDATETALFQVNEVLLVNSTGDENYNETQNYLKLDELFSLSSNPTIMNAVASKYLRGIVNSYYLSGNMPLLDGLELTHIDSDIYKYQYANPYEARKAAESEIISFFYNCQNISDISYGKYTYELSEIQTFLIVYAKVRDYYYKVLLNESFINENKYGTYERFFITAISLEKTLSAKLDSLKDVDSYNIVDIENFFESYGLEKLSALLKIKNNFYNSEEISKRIIKNYTKLSSNKGSKGILGIIEDIFSLDDNSLNIYNDLLAYNANSTNNEYRLISINNDTKNIYKELKSKILSGSTLSNAINNAEDPVTGDATGDIYWNIDNTTATELESNNLYVVYTKYLEVIYSEEVSKKYIVSRCALAIIEHYFPINAQATTYNSAVQIPSSDVFSSSIQIGDVTNFLKYLYTEYIIASKTQGNMPSINSTFTFKLPISVDFLNKYSRYFKSSSALGSNIGANTNETYYVYNPETFYKISNGKYVVGDETKQDNTVYYYNFTINDELLNYDFNWVSETNDLPAVGTDAKIIKTVLEYTLPLINFSSNYSYLSTLTTDSAQSNFVNNFNILLELAYAYSNGGFTNFSYPNISGKANLFLNELFNYIFISGTNETTSFILNYNATNAASTLALLSSQPTVGESDDYKDAIYNVSDVLNSTLGLSGSEKISFSLSEDRSAISNYIKTAINYFISYKAQIRTFNFVKDLDNKAEGIGLYDKVHFAVNETQVDSFYYDDKLKITKVE